MFLKFRKHLKIKMMKDYHDYQVLLLACVLELLERIL